MRHESIEKSVNLMMVLIVIAISIGGLVEIIPLMLSSDATEPDEGIAPYSALRLAGRDVYVARCSTCHGSDGGGGRGPKLNDGTVVESFPDPAAQAEVIADGKGQMPSFFGQLSQSEIDAVVRYTREVLG